MCDPWARHRISVHDGPVPACLVSALSQHGFALIDGVPAPATLLRLARTLTTIEPHRDSDAAGLTTITNVGGQVRSGFAGFSACALSPHTDRSGTVHPPAMLMMACGQPARSGGACLVIDGKAVYDDLAESHPRAVQAFSSPRSVLFGGAAGYLGSIFTNFGDRVTVRFRLDELARFSPEITYWLPTFRAALARHAHTLRLAAGQGYILDNHRWLHGRHAFTGPRVMYRVTGNPLPWLGITPGFQSGRVLTSSGAR